MMVDPLLTKIYLSKNTIDRTFSEEEMKAIKLKELWRIFCCWSI